MAHGMDGAQARERRDREEALGREKEQRRAPHAALKPRPGRCPRRDADEDRDGKEQREDRAPLAEHLTTGDGTRESPAPSRRSPRAPARAPSHRPRGRMAPRAVSFAQ